MVGRRRLRGPRVGYARPHVAPDVNTDSRRPRADARVPLIALALLCVLAQSACGSSGATSSSGSATSSLRPPSHASGSSRTVRLSYRPLFSLAAAVQDPAGAAFAADRFVLLGGLTAQDTSTADVVQADLRGPLHTASLPNAQHDAQAAQLAGKVYVFGGGQFNQYDHILAYDPAANAISNAGSLPSAASDVAVAAAGDSAYVIGGFDGVHWLNTILAWQPGSRPRVVGRLPVPLRYAAAAAAGGYVVIAGGTTPHGVSNAIVRFDPRTRELRVLGHLPHALTHAGAAAIGDTVYIVGGYGESGESRTARLWAINPAAGSIRAAGRLPHPLSDAGVLSAAGGIIVAGGRTAAGTEASVGKLVPAG
jgi:Kelch motif